MWESSRDEFSNAYTKGLFCDACGSVSVRIHIVVLIEVIYSFLYFIFLCIFLDVLVFPNICVLVLVFVVSGCSFSLRFN